jgi:Flp pilus assembly pilin Flp
MVLYGTEVCFLVVVIALALAFGLDDVGTAQLGQGVNTVWSSIAFWLEIVTACPSQSRLTRRTFIGYRRFCASLPDGEGHQ